MDHAAVDADIVALQKDRQACFDDVFLADDKKEAQLEALDAKIDALVQRKQIKWAAMHDTMSQTLHVARHKFQYEGGPPRCVAGKFEVNLLRMDRRNVFTQAMDAVRYLRDAPPRAVVEAPPPPPPSEFLTRTLEVLSWRSLSLPLLASSNELPLASCVKPALGLHATSAALAG